MTGINYFSFVHLQFLAQCLNNWQMAEMKNNLKYHFSAPRIYQCQPRMGTKRRCRTADERIIVESKIIKTSQEARNFWVICSQGCVFKDLLTETMKSEKSEVAQLSNYLWPHGLWPTRLLRLQDFPGKNAEVGCYFLLQGNLPDPGIEPRPPAL